MKRPKYPIFKDEHPDILEELKLFTNNVELWLDTPNEALMGDKPRDLIGTDREIHVRNLLRRIKHGIPT